MTAYLVANPPRRSQYRKVRRAKPTGTIVLHSAENAPDLRPPDEGAERIASFIRNRTDPGSYHVIADQDSRIQLVPFSYEAFHDGTGSNPWSIGLSLALRASDWPKLTKQQQLWYMASLAVAARGASDWLKVHHNVSVPVRRLTKASASQPGFCTHQDREDWFGTPGRRTDPWRNDPEMWHLFLTLYEDTASTRPPTTVNAEDDDMSAPHVELIKWHYRRSRGATYDPATDPKDRNGFATWMLALAGAQSADARNAVVTECGKAIDAEIAAKR